MLFFFTTFAPTQHSHSFRLLQPTNIKSFKTLFLQDVTELSSTTKSTEKIRCPNLACK